MENLIIIFEGALYIDPGSGALLLQLLLAGAAGALFHVTKPWRRLKSIITRWMKRSAE